MAYIDDATNKVYGRFYEYEGTIPAMERNDFTIAHDGKLYQIQEPIKTKKVLVEERTDGKMLITYNDVRLKFAEITARPEKQQKLQGGAPRHGKGHTPSADHPWRKSNHQLFNKRQSQRKRPMDAVA
jgi:hypothetical protein